MMEFIYSFTGIIGAIIALPGIFYLFLPISFEKFSPLAFMISIHIVMFKFLLDIPLSYYLYKFKNKKNNIILFHDIKFCIIMGIIWETGLWFLFIKIDLDNFYPVGCLFISMTLFLESIIRTIICFKKKDKKKYKSSLIITLSLFIVMLIAIISEYKLIQLPEDLNIILSSICGVGVFIAFSIPPIIMSFYAVSSTFFTFYLIYKSIRKLLVRNKNIS